MKKQKPIIICDYCKKELHGDYIRTEDVPNEGCSVIEYKRKYFDVADQDYCSLECLMHDIAKKLGINVAENEDLRQQKGE